MGETHERVAATRHQVRQGLKRSLKTILWFSVELAGVNATLAQPQKLLAWRKTLPDVQPK
jgi:membrane protein required for beta-lactamase induction